MKKSEKQEIGGLCFWNEIVVYYRNKRNKAAKDGTCQDVINFTELLKESRQELKHVEGIILRGAAVLIVLVAMLVCQGCIENTMRGLGNMVIGTGQLVSGVGQDVVRGTDGYSNER